jgi:hypothetical protein
MKCKACNTTFIPKYFNQKFCVDNDECLKAFSDYAKITKEKTERKEWTERKSKLKKQLLTVQDYLKIAQQVFNAYIRKRDQGKNCISCGKVIKDGNCDAGHLWSAGGHSNIRFNELNVNSQCSRPCNKDLSGDPNNYRIGFIQKYGKEKLEYLDSIAHAEKKYNIDELKELIKIYKEKLK